MFACELTNIKQRKIFTPKKYPIGQQYDYHDVTPSNSMHILRHEIKIERHTQAKKKKRSSELEYNFMSLTNNVKFLCYEIELS